MVQIDAMATSSNGLMIQVLLVAVTLLLYRLWVRSARGSGPTPERTPTPKSERTWGEWTAVEFAFPRFKPCSSTISSIKPPPYRPFRWGQYNITMGIRSMKFEEWIEVDQQLPHYHRIKSHRIATRGDKVVDTLPESTGIPSGAPAARELMYELSEYLSRRYPDDFRVLSRHPSQEGDYGWYNEGQIKELEMVSINAKYDLDTEDPMTLCALLIEDDLALMVEGSDGRYYFQAGAICVPGFWRMEDMIGLPLEEIHLRGEVPQYKEKLHVSLARFFQKLAVDKPVLRNNYFFQIVDPALASDPTEIDPDEIAWSYTTNGDEDLFDQATKEPFPELLKKANDLSFDAQAKGAGVEEVVESSGRQRAKFVPPQPTTSVDYIRLRTERQSLRRLPRSGAIVFTVRTYIFPIVDLANEPGVPGRMASAIRSWPEEVMVYKGQRLYKDAILPYLDRSHAEQVADGSFSDDDRSSQYPY